GHAPPTCDSGASFHLANRARYRSARLANTQPATREHPHRDSPTPSPRLADTQSATRGEFRRVALSMRASRGPGAQWSAGRGEHRLLDAAPLGEPELAPAVGAGETERVDHGSPQRRRLGPPDVGPALLQRGRDPVQ